MHWTVKSFVRGPVSEHDDRVRQRLTGIGSNAGAVIDAVSIELASARATAPVLGVPGLLVAALGLFALGIFWRRRSDRP